jgi:hypothetical protein
LWKRPWLPLLQQVVVVPHEHDGTTFSTHFGTIRQHMTVSVTGTQTRTVRVQGTSISFGTHFVTVYWHCSATQRVRVHGTVMVFWTILQVVTQ